MGGFSTGGPGGTIDGSPAFSTPGARRKRNRVPEGHLKSTTNLSPHVFWVVFHIVFLQEREELFFETSFAVMLGLRLDIGDRICLL